MLTRLRQTRALRALVRRLGVHRVAAVLGLVQLPALALVELVVRRRPRDDRLVAMGSPLDRFSDNAAYLFVHLSEHSSRLRPVWISGSPETVNWLRRLGYRAERRASVNGARTALRAGTYIYSAYRSDINRWLAPGAVSVALWHGLPIKRVEAGIADHGLERGRLLDRFVDGLLDRGREASPDYLLSSSERVTGWFSPAFGVPVERCWELGYPRDDHLLTGPRNPPAALRRPEDVWQRVASAGRVVGLFLTWRDERVDDAVGETLLRRVAETCARHDALLVYKAHYNVAATSAPPDCLVLPAEADLHAYLGSCDVLVTDYSSVALDFLLLRRPVVYFMPDLEHYARQRGFAVDPAALPGILTREPETLLSALAGLLGGSVTWSPTASDEEFVRSMWGEYAGHAAKAIEDAVLSLRTVR